MATLVDQVSKGEIKLPEIQRGYVWKATQTAKLVESLYREYPTGSLLLWKASEVPITREMAIGTVVPEPVVVPLYLLDGQQRLTALHRVFSNHEGAQIIFNIETEKFQNQSPATARDPRWIKVFDVLKGNMVQLAIKRAEQLPDLGMETILERFHALTKIGERQFHMEILEGFSYQEITEIFVRVNSGGRSLKASDLVLATLTARWPGVLGKLQDEAERWKKEHYDDLDITFLTRALAGVVLGRGLSTGAHARLVAASDAELEKGLDTVKRGLQRLVPLLQENLKLSRSSLMPSHNVLLPLIVLLGEWPEDKAMDGDTANGILYWFLVATIKNRYSASTDTLLGQDIPTTREDEPVKKLLTSFGVMTGAVSVTPGDLAGRTVGSPYFFLSYLVAKHAGARDWWFGTEISAIAEDGRKLEYHHIHPQATLTRHTPPYGKSEINDLANLAFISGKANRRISDRSPADYFVAPEVPPLTEAELAPHFVPYDEDLRTAGQYREFLKKRRSLLADAMTALLDKFRPSWLDEHLAATVDLIAGHSLEFQLYQSSWDIGRMVATAKGVGFSWTGSFTMDDFEDAIRQASDQGLSGDIEIAGASAPVTVSNETVEIPIGPFLAIGSIDDWKDVISREKETLLPQSQLPVLSEEPWNGELVRFPASSIE
ncbi:DUF262 domain-containing protein [Actinomadura sp. KC06]|uniref:GmrSD restriction endonuclease domain-containing protein n=1 Tax=Actinomadura sp. KC06 TaxID=2530369 RepID=UPI001404F48E|nr:DUF262 domain-containing protein [Actinomadura sp. KC06]